MTLVAQLVFVVLLTLLLASLLTGPVGWRHNRAGERAIISWIFTIMVLLPLIWAATIWLPPAGPVVVGVPWVGPLLVGLLVAFLLAALAPPRRSIERTPRTERDPGVPASDVVVAREERVFADVMLWVFLALGVGLIAFGYAV